MKYDSLHIAKHDDPKMPGFETKTLIVNGKVDRYGYYKSGEILMQFFARTVGEAEENCEYVYQLLKKESEGER